MHAAFLRSPAWFNRSCDGPSFVRLNSAKREFPLRRKEESPHRGEGVVSSTRRLFGETLLGRRGGGDSAYAKDSGISCDAHAARARGGARRGRPGRGGPDLGGRGALPRARQDGGRQRQNGRA